MKKKNIVSEISATWLLIKKKNNNNNNSNKNLSDFVKTWPLRFRLAPGQTCVQKGRALAVLVGTAE